MKKRTAFIGAILSLLPLGQPLLIKTGLFLSSFAVTLSLPVKVIAESADEYFDNAFEMGESGNHKGAILNYTKVIELEPNNYIAYMNRGWNKAQLGDYYAAIEDHKGAISDFTKAIEIDPKDSIPYLNRGLSQSNLGDEYAAISDYNKAIALNPQYLKAYYNRAWSKKEIGDTKGGIEDYTKVIDLNPRYYQAYVNRGIIRSDLGDKRAACKDYKKSISLGDTETANWLKKDSASWCREMEF